MNEPGLTMSILNLNHEALKSNPSAISRTRSPRSDLIDSEAFLRLFSLLSRFSSETVFRKIGIQLPI